jgi:hypothetical protein
MIIPAAHSAPRTPLSISVSLGLPYEWMSFLKDKFTNFWNSIAEFETPYFAIEIRPGIEGKGIGFLSAFMRVRRPTYSTSI